MRYIAREYVNEVPSTQSVEDGQVNKDWRHCTQCGDDMHSERWALGYRLCLFCGEEAAQTDRASWCVVQPYGKGPYMLVTVASAHQTVKDTNQKSTRSD